MDNGIRTKDSLKDVVQSSGVERMHFSLGGTGLGRTWVGRVLSVRGSGRVCPGSSGRWLKCTLTGILESHRAILQALTIIGGAGFITWCLTRLFFRGMPTGPDAFLELQGVSELWPCVRNHQKSHCTTFIQLVVPATNTDNLQAVRQYRKNIPNCCITLVLCIFVLLL